jgi:hypothetical protein
MANEKKPSIYSDRSTIGSSDELDEYGVWVKSESQDLPGVNTENQISEESVPDLDNLPDFGEEPLLEEEDLPDIDITTELGGEDLILPDIEDLPDFDLTENDLSDAGTEESVDLFSDDKSENPDISLDASGIDLGGETEEPDEDIVNFDEMSHSDDTLETPDGDDAFAEISMDDFLGEVPGDLDTSSFADSAAETVKKAEPEERKSPLVKEPETKKSQELDLSTQLLMKIAEELSSIKMEISSLKQELAGIRSVPETEDEGAGKGFLDEADDEKIALTGDELNNIFNTANFTEETGADAAESTAEDFFPEDEIEAQPEEAAEFAAQSREVSELIAEPPAGEADDSAGEESFPGEISFEDSMDISSPEDMYDENVSEDDLVPEEPLDIFEEGAETTEPEISEEDSVDIDISDEPISAPLGFEYIPEDIPPEEDSTELRILQEEGVTPMTAAPEDTSYLEEEAPADFEEETPVDFEEESLADFGEETPIDFEEEPLADFGEETPIDFGEEPLADFEEESLDLSNAVIDEPDLSGDVVENPIQEPSPESISLDLEQEEALEIPREDGEEFLEFSEDESEELSLDIPEVEFDSDELSSVVEDFQADETAPEDESFAQVLPEDFVVEADNSQISFDNALAMDETPMEEEGIPYAGEGFEEVSEKPGVPDNLKQELRVVLSYMDQLLESLPEDKIEEFAQSEYYDTYKKLFEELGLV